MSCFSVVIDKRRGFFQASLKVAIFFVVEARIVTFFSRLFLDSDQHNQNSNYYQSQLD